MINSNQVKDNTVHASYFANVMDTLPIGRVHSLDRLLGSLSTRIWFPAVTTDLQARKLSTPLISGAVYAPGATRCRDEVLGIHLGIIDLDNGRKVPGDRCYPERDGSPSDRPILVTQPVERPVTVAEAADRMWAAGIAGVAYATLSHTPGRPKTRIILPLAEAVPVDLWPQAADWILSKLGLDERIECVDLPHLRNPAAVAVLPTQPVNGPLLRQRVDGDLLRVPLDEIRDRPLLAPPEAEWQRTQRMERLARMATLPSPHRIWREVCDPADLLRELGCTIFRERPWAHGTKCRTTCPWAAEHNGGLDDDAGVIYYPTAGRPGWRCAHSGHAHLGMTDLLRATGRF